MAARTNNFNLIRAAASVAVLVSHAYVIGIGPSTIEPLGLTLGINLGQLAVVTFFAVSGYFISQSFQAKSSVADFIVARVLRIYPGLLVALLLSAFLLGPVFTTLSLHDYLADPEALLYVPRNARLWPMYYPLPGVFEHNPFPQAVNGSLWTLAYEVTCYALVFVVGILGFARTPRRFALVLIAYLIAHIVIGIEMGDRNDHAWYVVRQLHFLSYPFVIGMALHAFRAQIRYRLPVVILLAAIAAASYSQDWFRYAFILAWSYAIFWFGFRQIRIVDAYNRIGDYSYGIYIYAFPIEQSVAALWPGCAPIEMMVVALPATVIAAALSWHLIERPAIGRRRSVAGRIEGWIAAKPAAES